MEEPPTDEKVENDISDDDVKGTEKDHGRCEVATIGFPVIGTGRTKRRQYHAIVHDFVPVFARHNAEQHDDTPGCATEIRLPLQAQSKQCQR